MYFSGNWFLAFHNLLELFEYSLEIRVLGYHSDLGITTVSGSSKKTGSDSFIYSFSYHE